MPRQNRVSPFSAIEADPARGLFTGNRGILHDAQGRMISTRWRHPHWIICELKYKDWRRPIAAPGRWTELFFLDEAVALAAGHRPCAFCRRSAYLAYRAAAGLPASAKAIDAILHAQRVPLIDGAERPLRPLGDLPAGAFFVLPEEPLAPLIQLESKVMRWTHAGYQPHPALAPRTQVSVLTPLASVAALQNGYAAVLHPSAF
jgi:hypothetical protein